MPTEKFIWKALHNIIAICSIFYSCTVTKVIVRISNKIRKIIKTVYSFFMS